MPGEFISHYRILEKLGEGGMGVVYKAEDTKLGRTVALKFLPPELTRDPDSEERFINEARAASALDHPNICTIYEVGRAEDGRTFIAMACYEGENLQDRIARGPLPVDEAIDIALQAAEGLSKAHGRGIVHRDIKPANIFVTSDGLVKIVDFGLAKLAGMKLTKTGGTLGTAKYMSPEQARGEQVDQRTDIWSLGIVLYEMLTGKHAFPGEYDQAALYAIINQDPEPVTALRTGVPMELERITCKCLVKDTGERYQHADEVAADLRHLRTTRAAASSAAPSSSRPPGIRVGTGRAPARWWPWVAGLCVAAVVMTGVFYRYRGPSGVAPGPERKMLVVLPFVNLGAPENEYFAAGITEEITSRLATIRELGVISRTSAVHYAGTSKTAREIGSELGVAYILEGTVRWAPEPGGTSKVRITPQLIRVSDDTHLWSEPYDRVMQDIFEIQSDIAKKVVEHLGLALLHAEHPAVDRRPTDDLDAYQAYLRAEYFAGQPHFVAQYWEEAAQNYRRAVELDPDFAQAHAKLSIAHGRLYYYRHDLSDERRSKAGAAIDRAVELQPDDPQIRLALGYFHLLIERDVKAAFREFDRAAKDLPDNAEILEARGNACQQAGRWEEALAHYRKACELDPLNASHWENLAETCWWTRSYPEAMDACDRAIALAPDQMWPYLDKVFNFWSWTGKSSLKESRRALEAMGPGSDPAWIAWAWFNQAACEGNYLEALGHLESLPGDWLRIKIGACPKSLLSAQIHEIMGEPEKASDDFEKARDLLEKEVAKRPDDPRYHSSLGIAFAALGRRDEAVREGKRAVELLPMSKDAVYGIPYVVDLAQIHAILGEQDAALAQLEILLSRPSWVSPAFLEMDFRWNRIRDSSGYKRLMKKYSGAEG